MRRALATACAVGVIVGCGGADAAVAPAGIVGRVVEGPICPVERVPPDPSCAPRPLAARVLMARVGSRASTTITSGTNGYFRVRLAPGTYLVRAERLGTSPLPRPPAPLAVRVLPHRFTRLTLSFDTGIR